MTQREPIDDLLDQSSPLLDAELETTRFTVLLADLGTAAQLEAVETRPSPGPGSRERKAAAAAAALAVVTATVSGVPAAAEWISLKTGRYERGNPWHRSRRRPRTSSGGRTRRS